MRFSRREMGAAIARLTSEAIASAFNEAAAPYAVDDLLTTPEAAGALAQALVGSPRDPPLSYVTGSLNGHMTVWSAEEARRLCRSLDAGPSHS
jgi:hypothetical protein